MANTYLSAFHFIRADYKRYRKLARGGGILKVLIHERGFKYSFWMRLAAVRGVFRPFFWIIYHHYSSKYGIQIPTNIPIGPGLYIGHGIGMAINGTAKIGKNVSLSQFLTIASNKGHAATIEDNVYIASHVCIVEDVTIGHDATIGAGAVVTKDIPPYAVAVGVPAKVIKFKEHD